jgi:hypothetical protein
MEGIYYFLALLIRRVIKSLQQLSRNITVINYIQDLIQHSSVKVESIYRQNYYGLSVWMLTQSINYWSDILHSSDTEEKMGVQWDSASTIYKL